jgi:D-specific alpha-keto acid dehydrogenase
MLRGETYRRRIEIGLRPGNIMQALLGSVTHRASAHTAASRNPTAALAPTLAASDHSHVPDEPICSDSKMGITIYGCGHDEALMFRAMAPRCGMVPTITEAPVSEANSELASGNRCISVDHRYQINNSTLLALRQAGVRYISTRSIGYDHIHVRWAESIGISVENVDYSPDSVADYTLMLMLMLVRDTKSTMSRVQAHDYRLNTSRAKELRDLTVGVVGTGRIGAAVIERLRGFGGCRVLAHDRWPKVPAEYVGLEALLQQSDVVTLHTPLNEGTRHILNGLRLAQMKHGAFIVNTGRGALIDTQALLPMVENGRLGGVALDVLEGEEGVFYSDCGHGPINNQALLRLQQLPNVLITPHTAFFTDHALSDTVANTLANCVRFLESSAAWSG